MADFEQNPPADTGAADTTAADNTKLEQHQRARDAGWTETTAFDYDSFQRQGGDDGKFLGEAAVYEWSGEYGDVAPEVPELEKILFGTEHRTIEGEHRNNIDLEVGVEGPTSVKPIRTVSHIRHHPHMPHLTDHNAVRRCRTSPGRLEQHQALRLPDTHRYSGLRRPCAGLGL